MDDFWQRVARLRDGQPQSQDWHQTELRRLLAIEDERKREDAAIKAANEILVNQGFVLCRHNILDNPSLGKFVIKRIETGEITATNVSPQRIARSLYEGVTFR